MMDLMIREGYRTLIHQYHLSCHNGKGALLLALWGKYDKKGVLVACTDKAWKI